MLLCYNCNILAWRRNDNDTPVLSTTKALDEPCLHAIDGGIGVSFLKGGRKMRVFKRKFKSGVKWGVDYTIGGIRKRVIVGETRKEAQDFMEEIIQNKNRIKIGLPADGNGKPIPKTVNEALEIYFQEKVPSFRSTNIIKVTLGKGSTFRKKFGDLNLGNISRNDMEAFRDRLLKQNMAYNSVRRTMTCIQSFLSWCKGHKPPWCEGENPASSLFKNCRTVTLNPGYVRQILTFDEVHKIIELAMGENEERADLFWWLFCSMQRPSEAKKIEFKDFYEEHGKWYLRITQTKRAGKVKVLEIDGPLEEIRQRQVEKRNGREFFWSQDLFDPHAHCLKKYCQKLGIPLREGNGLYCLKHSAVSYHLNVLATPVKIVSDISGVTVAVLISYYTKSTEGQRRAALKNLGWHVSGTREDNQISHPSQTLDSPILEEYPS